MGKMLEKGHQNVKEIWRKVDCSKTNLCKLSLVFDLDGIDHLQKTFFENLINLLLIP